VGKGLRTASTRAGEGLVGRLSAIRESSLSAGRTLAARAAEEKARRAEAARAAAVVKAQRDEEMRIAAAAAREKRAEEMRVAAVAARERREEAERVAMAAAKEREQAERVAAAEAKERKERADRAAEAAAKERAEAKRAADAAARERAEEKRVADAAARERAEEKRAAEAAARERQEQKPPVLKLEKPSIAKPAGRPAAAAAANQTAIADLEDTNEWDPPFRYFALASREGFVLVTKPSGGSADQPESWTLEEPESGLLLTVLTSDRSVRESTLHYNVRTDDESLLHRTPPEYRDLESRTVYVREPAIEHLRARCRRLRAAGNLVPEWKVSPPIELRHPARKNVATANGPRDQDSA